MTAALRWAWRSARSATLFAASTAPLSLAFAQAAPPPVRFELPNGLRVWVQEDHTRPVALVQVAYKVGAINETPGTTGTAHYVEHMVYRATEHIKNEDVYGYIDRIGGRYTGGTSRDGTTYSETVPSWALEDAIRVTAERMGHALFDSLEFERERNNVVTEANGFSRTDPVTALHDAAMLASFELHPYRYSSNTWSQDNLWIRRNDAYDFWRKFYGPNNAVLSIVGDVDVETARRLVTKHFSPLARAPFSGEVRVVEPPQRAEKRVTLRAPADRAMIDIVWRAPQAGHADYPVLAVLDRVLAPRLQTAIAAVGGSDLTTAHQATPYPYVYRIQASAAPGADVEKIVAVIQSEIDRLRNVAAISDLAAARVEPTSGGRGGRGRGAGGTGTAATASAAGGVPPRQTSLTAVAAQLTARETFSWEVGPELRERIRVAQLAVSTAEIAAYVDRWLRVSQRTIGVLVPGADDFQPRWSNGRAIVGERLEIPPLTTPPSPRSRPTPVPARSLEPLAPISLRTARRQLPNNVVIRAVQTSGQVASLQVRVRFGANSDPAGMDAIALLAARLISNDSALQARGARSVTTSLANDGWFDIRFTVQPADAGLAAQTAVRALHPAAFTQARIDDERTRMSAADGGRGGRGGGRGAGVAADARDRVIRAIAPAWRLSDPSADAVARLSAADVNAFVARRLTGGAITVSLAAPRDVNESLGLVATVFGTLDAGERAADRAADRAAHAEVVASIAADDRVSVAGETQVTVVAGLPGISRGDPDAPALELLNYIAGVPSYGGRLGWALTKAGLAYSSAAATTFGASAGHITFSTKCDTRNTPAAVQAIREVVEGLQERGVDEWEVNEAKAFTLGRMLLYGPREDSGEDAIATALLDSETQGTELLDPAAWSRAYLAVTPAQVTAAARKYYRPDKLTVTTIGAVPPAGTASPFAPGTFKRLF